ncbi:hypothetical protein GCM10010954_21620 [Halobacillus andaensis]|uniref:Uncharacterized protein n=1 Tax=Halobacillus andaensis TaxID=1176239 RepID=A0A917B452_HALAA|nr:hypothetical protein [Halobacillus andaensis]MBP2004328.1 inhibitor of the pro-sigma K processing machinery [Halobacillus andaensis]GGF22485.1 hypothetical protein GCM10010954_21620 [Halobacillus andaensis]
MRKLLEKVIRLALAIMFFYVLWKGVGALWEMFVPINYKTNLIALIIVNPIMILVSFILSALTFEFIRKS